MTLSLFPAEGLRRHNSRGYFDMWVGIPFKEHGRDFNGCDCWGLVRLWYKDKYNVHLPSYVDDYENVKDKNIAATMQTEKEKWLCADSPEYGDVVLLRMAGLPMHCGVYLGKGKVLHVERGCDSIIEDLRRSKWKNRIMGYYRMK